jgi:hypothetical protein
MKTFPLIGLVLCLLCAHNNAQTPAENSSYRPTTPTSAPYIAETFDEAKAQGVSPHIDSVYMNAVNVDSNKAAFKGHTHEFIEAYRQMLGDLATSLRKNETFKNKGFQFYNRVYFAADGSINYYLYNQVRGLTKDEEALFKKLLNDFIKAYKLPMSAKTPFAQCSPVNIAAPGK